MKKKLIKLLLTLIAAIVGFFVVTFTVYFFNLDMKLTAALSPFIEKLYDHVKRDRHL